MHGMVALNSYSTNSISLGRQVFLIQGSSGPYMRRTVNQLADRCPYLVGGADRSHLFLADLGCGELCHAEAQTQRESRSTADSLVPVLHHSSPFLTHLTFSTSFKVHFPSTTSFEGP